MKKILIPCLVILLASCGNAENADTSKNENEPINQQPISIDTITHPTGVNQGGVISTDTAAINIQNTYKKADSGKH